MKQEYIPMGMSIIESLPLKSRLELLYDLIQIINQKHLSGSAHGRVYFDNIQLEVEESVLLIKFSCDAQNSHTTDKELAKHSEIRSILPPEFYNSEQLEAITMQSDVYMLASIVSTFLCLESGDKHETLKLNTDKLERSKTEIRHHNSYFSDLINNDFSTEGLTGNEYIHELLNAFLCKMKSQHPDFRPKITEVSAFFKVLMVYGRNNVADVTNGIEVVATLAKLVFSPIQLLNPVRSTSFVLASKQHLSELLDKPDKISWYNSKTQELFDTRALSVIQQSKCTWRLETILQKQKPHLNKPIFEAIHWLLRHKGTESEIVGEAMHRLERLHPADPILEILTLETLEHAPNFNDGIYQADALESLKSIIAENILYAALVSQKRDSILLQHQDFATLKEFYDFITAHQEQIIVVFKNTHIDECITKLDERMLELFKEAYAKRYGRLFHNPWSTMQQLIKSGELNSIEQVFAYAKQHPTTEGCLPQETRTASLLKSL